MEENSINLGGKVVYVLLVTSLAMFVVPQIYFFVYEPTRDSAGLYFVSLPAIFILGVVSFVFQSFYEAQSKIGWSLFVLIVNSFLAFKIGMLLTLLFL